MVTSLFGGERGPLLIGSATKQGKTEEAKHVTPSLENSPPERLLLSSPQITGTGRKWASIIGKLQE
jgi:hypothetical protein